MPKQKAKPEKEKIPSQEVKIGRPSIFTPELANKICEAVATSPYGIRKICAKHPEFPTPETIRVWRYQDRSFSAQYAQAKLDQADILAEEIIDIADDDSRDVMINSNGSEVFNSEFAARSRLRVDTRKWLASKMLPKLYGDRHEMEQKEEENAELREEIKALRAKLDEQNKRDY